MPRSTFSWYRPAVMPTLLAAVLAAGTVTTPTPGLARSRTEPAAKAANPAEPLVIVVSLRRQRLSVFNKDGQVIQSPVSSGQPDFPTPTGIFSVLGKEVEHESNIYDGAQMPYMQRLTWSGTAMHAGNLPGYAASHGCVRLPYGFSQHLFGMTQLNTRVIVTKDDVAPQPFAHANLFKPAPAAPSDVDQPMVNAATSKVASIAGMAPAPPAPAPSLPGLTAKAKARLAETQLLFDEIKTAESARAAVWEEVKAANRALEATKSEINGLQSTVDEAQREMEKAKRAKGAGETQLAQIMRKVETARTAEAIETLGKAEDAAEARLIELSDKLDAAVEKVATLKSGMAPAKARHQAAEAARRALDDDLKKSNLGLKNAQSAHTLAKREDARYLKPVSVLISRKTQRLYVRQGFEPVLEVPIIIDNPDQPVGTHVYTAMALKDGGRDLHWSVVSLNATRTESTGRRSKSTIEVDSRGATAAKALDRIQIPAEARDVIADLMKPGSSLIVSDEGTGPHFGAGTDFMVAVR